MNKLQYQNFINSLDFSVQFYVQSRKLNIEPYLDTLRQRLKVETGELLKIQITEYIEFIKTFVQTSEIVSKSFYIVIPYNPPQMQISGGAFDSILQTVGMKSAKTVSKKEKFDEQRAQLFQRVDAITQGLIRTGVRAVPLNTEELIELYYGLYRPGEIEGGKLPEITA